MNTTLISVFNITRAIPEILSGVCLRHLFVAAARRRMPWEGIIVKSVWKLRFNEIVFQESAKHVARVVSASWFVCLRLLLRTRIAKTSGTISSLTFGLRSKSEFPWSPINIPETATCERVQGICSSLQREHTQLFWFWRVWASECTNVRKLGEKGRSY